MKWVIILIAPKDGQDIKDLTPVRGQDWKISDTQGKDFWSPTGLRRVGDQYKSFPRVSEIFPSCSLTGVWFFFSLIYLSCTFSRAWIYFSLNIFVLLHSIERFPAKLFSVGEVNCRFIHIHPCIGSILIVFHNKIQCI